MGIVKVKPGVLFSVIAPAGFRILAAIDLTAAALGLDLTITSACDGKHSGPGDPHHKGEAYDIRTHDLTVVEKVNVLACIMGLLEAGLFFGFLEAAGTTNEHIHVQRRKGTVYPPVQLEDRTGLVP